MTWVTDTTRPLLTVARPGVNWEDWATATSALARASSGMGRNAGEQVADLLNAAPCRLLVSLGYAGALVPHLHPGQLVVGTSYLHGASAAIPGTPHTTRAAMLLRQSGLSVLEGAVLTVDEPLLTPLAKRRAHNGTGAMVVDMEGHWIANAAASRDIPLIGIPAVLDEAHFPPSVHRGNHRGWRPAGMGARFPAISHLFRGPEFPASRIEISQGVTGLGDGRARHSPGYRTSTVTRVLATGARRGYEVLVDDLRTGWRS